MATPNWCSAGTNTNRNSVPWMVRSRSAKRTPGAVWRGSAGKSRAFIATNSTGLTSCKGPTKAAPQIGRGGISDLERQKHLKKNHFASSSSYFTDWPLNGHQRAKFLFRPVSALCPSPHQPRPLPRSIITTGRPANCHWFRSVIFGFSSPPPNPRPSEPFQL